MGSIDQEAPLLRHSPRSGGLGSPLRKTCSYSSTLSGDSECDNGPASIFSAQRNGVNVRRLNHKSTSVRRDLRARARPPHALGPSQPPARGPARRR